MWPECSNDIPTMECKSVKQPGVSEMSKSLLDTLDKINCMTDRIAAMIYTGPTMEKNQGEPMYNPCCLAEGTEIALNIAKNVEHKLAEIINHL